MQQRLRWLAIIIAVVTVAGYAAWNQRIGINAVISEWRDPIAGNHAVTWQQGPSTAPAGKRPPNVILILADDLGYNDISVNGGGVAGGIVKTPHIDAIGREGVIFPIAYAANATCSPSRAALMTGRYPTRFGFEYTAVPRSFAWSVSHAPNRSPYPVIYHGDRTRGMIDYAEMGVPPSEITIAEALKARGYHTIQIGKWHLGEARDLSPNAQGFDESLGFGAGASKYMHQRDPGVVNARLPWDPIDRYLWPALPYAVRFNNGHRFEPAGHMTDYLTDNAIAAIKANRDRPFFMYLAYNAPHTPLQARRDDYDALAGIADHKTRVYGAMIRQLDRRIGDLLAALKAQGIDNDTLVIFTSDNGGAWYDGVPDLNKPFRGWKATFFEGGIRCRCSCAGRGISRRVRCRGAGLAPRHVRDDRGGDRGQGAGRPQDGFDRCAGGCRPRPARAHPARRAAVLAIGRVSGGARRRLEAAGRRAAAEDVAL